MNIIDVGLTYGNMTYGNRPKEKIVHHIEAEGTNWTVEFIHNMHRTDPKFLFSAIGYHYYIRLDGRIYRGRPDWAQGAHCQGANTNTLGIAFEGDYDKRKIMPQAQFDAWCELSDYLDSIYGDMPTYGHRERGSSECPGKYFPLDAVKQSKGAAVKPKGEWILDSTGWWFKYSDGTWPTGWAKLPVSNSNSNIAWFYFSNDGYMETQWVNPDRNWYYLSDDGCARQNEWGYDENNGKWYYFDDNCVMVQSKWIKDNSEWYYLKSDGSMATGWIKDNGKDYLLYSNGAMVNDTVLYGYRFESNGVATKIE